MKKVLFFMTMFALLAMPLGAKVYADESDGDFYPWRSHESPFDFKFNNMIDSHQQSYLDKNGVLHGFIKVDSGLPSRMRAEG